jgi:hypothetical protein
VLTGTPQIVTAAADAANLTLDSLVGAKEVPRRRRGVAQLLTAMAVPRNLKWYDTIAAIFVLLIISPPVALGQPTGTGGAVATTPRWQPLNDAAAMRSRR